MNLTAAQAVIHFDPWWNLSAQNQATDRAYRIGQLNKVIVHQLIMKESIEEKIQNCSCIFSTFQYLRAFPPISIYVICTFPLFFPL